MKLAYVDLCGFRGYSKRIRLDFANRFTIIDGRNGVGKSTIFDAVEFALTGTMAKYREQTASGETVADYIWWRGENASVSSRYVEVGFVDGNGAEISVRREEFAEPKPDTLESLTARLCDTRLAPPSPLAQLCQGAIIRDEHITTLSLDLRETDRYALLRNALGANDADDWIQRGSKLAATAKRRAEVAQQEVQSANTEVASAARRLDEQRARVASETAVGEAAARLRQFAASSAALDELTGPAREQIARATGQMEELRAISEAWKNAVDAKSKLQSLGESVAAARASLAAADAEVLNHSPAIVGTESLSGMARDLVSLLEIGRRLGLQEGHCPLCTAERTDEEFRSGMEAMEAAARQLNEDAVRAAQREQSRSLAEAKRAATLRALRDAEFAQQIAQETVDTFEQRRRHAGVAESMSPEGLADYMRQLSDEILGAQKDLRVLETARTSTDLERAIRQDAEAKARLSRAQERLGRALKAYSLAQALHDAARRAASETLDLRLERVLPLMSELYRRLRPHPIWSNIEYSIRGDVRRFLKLQVGENLNPQFLFSSGQRRATGLAFLISVNLSLAWSRWRTILMDDPVQHVDDFRAIHLAELAAKLVAEDRQIICAVEDSALADLFCRRLPVTGIGDGKRVTLGTDSEGANSITEQRSLPPLPRNSIVVASASAVAG